MTIVFQDLMARIVGGSNQVCRTSELNEILRRNDGNLHHSRVQVLLKMIDGIRNFYRCLQIYGIIQVFYSKNSMFSSCNHLSLKSAEPRILAEKTHRTAEFYPTTPTFRLKYNNKPTHQCRDENKIKCKCSAKLILLAFRIASMFTETQLEITI